MDLGLFLFSLSDFKTVDIIFLSCFLVLLLILIVLLIFKKIQDKKTAKILKEEFEKLDQNEKQEVEEVALEANPSEETEPEMVEPAFAEEVEEKAAPIAQTTPVEEKVEEEPTEEVLAEEPVVEEPEVKEENVEVEETKGEVEEPSEDVSEEVSEPVQEPTEEVNESEVEEEPVVETESPDEGNDMGEEKGRVYRGKYEIFQENNYYRYRLKASNGEILFVSEMYASRLTVLKSIEAVKRNLETGKTQIIVDKKKNYKFKLTAANHRVLAISANYPTEKGAQSALESFKRFAITDDIVDIEIPAEAIDNQLVEISKVKEEDKKGGKFVIRKDINGEFSWELKANNGEILCQLSGYSSKNSVENGILAFKENTSTGKFYLSKDKNNNYQFKLYSQSGRLSVVGESYDSSNAVYSVVTSILNFTELATISDRTNQVAQAKKTTKKLKTRKASTTTN